MSAVVCFRLAAQQVWLQVTTILVLIGVCCQGVIAEEPPKAVTAILDSVKSLKMSQLPIGFWNYTSLAKHGVHMNETAVAEWADAGFTVPQGPSFDPGDSKQVDQMRQILDWCHARGMKLILVDPRCQVGFGEENGKYFVPPHYAQGVRDAVALFGNHPATFGYYIGDEPEAKLKDAFFECSRIQKQIAPNLHPFINLLPFFPGIEQRAGTDTWPNYLDQYCQKADADLLCYDCYVQMEPGQAGWDAYFENLRLNREAAWRNGIPFWNTILSTGHFRYRCPTYDDLRWQFNTTVASGAQGVMWYFYYMRNPRQNYRLAPIDEHWNRTPTYDDLRRLHKTFHRFYGDLFNRIVCTKVMFQPKPLGGGETFAPDKLVAGIEPKESPLLISEFVDGQGRPYVMLVNLSMTDNAQIDLTFAGKDTRLFSWNWDGREIEGLAYSSLDTCLRNEQGATVRHYLAPGQEAVYRVEHLAEQGKKQ